MQEDGRCTICHEVREAVEALPVAGVLSPAVLPSHPRTPGFLEGGGNAVSQCFGIKACATGSTAQYLGTDTV